MADCPCQRPRKQIDVADIENTAAVAQGAGDDHESAEHREEPESRQGALAKNDRRRDACRRRHETEHHAAMGCWSVRIDVAPSVRS